MNTKQAKQFVESLVKDIWIRRNAENLDKYYSKNLKGYHGSKAVNYADVENRLAYVTKHYKNPKCEIEDVIVSGNKIVFRADYSFIKNDDNEMFRTQVITIVYLADGKVESFWSVTEVPYDYKASS